ncbi:hypothetical protein DP939_43875 [Spongiactinospora rosea]|uniref:Uncharacterized protein n=1 Tax=Spongiactinospora rosea TaxID=2248750 RepID=A0A366LIW3_9ACTN|nr:hypothetical protein DP939_43875 [Spongiactinospora rosea]
MNRRVEMPTRILYAVDTATGERYRLMTLHPDGSLTADAPDMVEAIPIFQARGLSNEFIFERTRRRSNAYIRHVEEVIPDPDPQ